MATFAFVFPGQGSQSVGMLDAWGEHPAVREVLAEASQALSEDLGRLIREGPREALELTTNTQPVMLAAGIACHRAWLAETGLAPAVVAGHSLGEFSALAAAGALSFAAGLALVRRRGELMKLAGERSPGGMAAILGLDAEPVAELCARAATETGRFVGVANDNCPGQIVISGHEEALAAAMELVTDAGARKVVRLPISIAAHTPLMGSVAEEFAAAVDAAPLSAARMPVVANVTARPVQTPDDIRAELKAQLTSPVAWTDTVRYMAGLGVDTYVETGPGDVLLGLVKRIDRGAQRVKFEL